MCRLLAVASRTPIDVQYHLDAFTRVCRSSREYQGHGWGCAIWRADSWERYRTVQPIWEDAFRPTGDVRMLVAHARSAFRDEDIVVENNMPFVSAEQVFVFNGELHGVTLPVSGRTGADRLFRFIRNPVRNANVDGLVRTMSILRRRTSHIRACNFIIAEPGSLIVHSLFSGEPEYFTLHKRQTPDELILCSVPYENTDPSWTPLANDSIEVFPCSF
jgi:glutamine amidotransferase